ncbi:MAG: NADP-dependent oxidoreductase [Rhodobacteraceae bacterium]|nr:NADP-dependent oxidoreductase [Paracoccaceae bacterium]
MSRNTRVVLSSRPKGVPTPEHFRVEEAEVPEPGEGQFLVRNRYWSVDPTQRGWANDAPNYLPPVAIDEVMRGFAVGEIVASRHPDYAEGDVVSGLFGWQSHALSDGSNVTRKVLEGDMPLSYALGILGLNGVTAYFGLLDLCDPQPGETVVVSTAAGAVGSAVGQIARMKGCRTVGVAGGPDKTALCREKFGYDIAIDYKAGDIDAALTEACPDGVDCYFDNTCGPISDAVMARLALRARIVVCGTAAITDWDPTPMGPRVHRQILVARARMMGLIAFDYKHRWEEAVADLTGWLRDGKLAANEHILDGPSAAPGAIEMLYTGQNTGKLLIKVDAD